jgi:ribosomal-protein-alanine N-acetyltransferase
VSDFAALAENAETLARLHAAALSASLSSVGGAAPFLGANWPAEAFAGALRSPGVFAVLIGHRQSPVAGFALARAVGDEGELLHLAVLPAARRQGLARKLLSAVIAYAGAVGVRRLVLEVAEENPAALGLYRGFGFLQVGRRPNYYSGASGPGAPNAPGGPGGWAAILALGIEPGKANDRQA